MLTETAGGTGSGRPRLPRYIETHWAILTLFLFFVVARYISLGARMGIFAAIRVEFTLGLLLTALCIGIISQQPLDTRPYRNLLIAIICLFFTMLVQLPFAADPVIAKTVFVDRVIKFAFLTFFMIVLIRSPRYMFMFILAFLFSCFYITEESVEGLITGGLMWENQGVMRLHGAVPIYMHPNSLGGLAMGAIPFCVFLFTVWRKLWLRAFLLALAGTAVVCVIYSGSRTAYVAILGFLVFWGATARRKIRWAGTTLLVGAIVLMVIPRQYIERFESIGGEEKEGRSKETRIQILSDAWQVFLENPGGVGVASFPAVRMKRFGRFQDTHNLYLEVATNLGVQGLIVFTFLVVSMLKALRRAGRSFARQRRELRSGLRSQTVLPGDRQRMQRHDRDLEFLGALSRATAAFVYVRLLLGLFGMDLYEIYWWFAAGMAASLLNLESRTVVVTKRLLAGSEDLGPGGNVAVASARGFSANISLGGTGGT